jgi:Pro-kumamolisin, activation domain
MVRDWNLSWPGRGGRPRGRRLTAGIGGAVSLTAVGALLTMAAPAQAGTAAVPVGAAAPVPQGAARLGTAPGAAVMHVDVVLAPRNAAALTQYATDVGTPGSPLYHDYLSPGGFTADFGASSAAIASVRSALAARGLHPGAISANHLSIPVTATASALESAFSVHLAQYRLAGGRTAVANTSAPVLPAAAAAHVQAVIGLDNLVTPRSLQAEPSDTAGAAKPASRDAAAPLVKTGGPQPCQAAVDATLTNFPFGIGFTADELAFSYGFSALYKAGHRGAGQTIAIEEFGEPDLKSDISTFQRCYGLHNSVTYQAIDGFSQTGPGAGEAALDIEIASMMAPRANVIVYRSPNTNAGFYDVNSAITTQDRARVVSISYGTCEKFMSRSLASSLHVLYEQAAVQGQTVVASSGDRGSEGCLQVDNNPSELSVNYPASDPFVLGIGGTTIETQDPLRSPPGEVVWNDGGDGDGAGGGGKSTIYAMPSYQKSYLKVKSGVREVPDVSADADPEAGYVVFWNGGWNIFGGTSAAAPLWAALLSLTDNECPATPVGFVNPTLYFVFSSADKVVVGNNIVVSKAFPGNVNNDYTGQGGGHYAVLAGYDMATGLGTPRAGALAGQLCKFSAQAQGYRVATAAGQVFSFHAPSHGSLAGQHLASKVVGIADDPHTNGYWLVTAKGRVYAFDAPAHGSVTGKLASPVVGIASDASGSGYWVVTAKGRVYAFGAPAHGSVTGSASPVTGIAGDPFSRGYWVVTANGKVHAFSAGRYPAKSIGAPVTAIAADPGHQGYWLVTATGKVVGFNVASAGNLPAAGRLGRVIGLAGNKASAGYWLVTATGHVSGIKAAWHGSHPGLGGKDPAVGIAATR